MMPGVESAEVRRFYRVAMQRLEDGQIIALERPAAAIYLGGYAVECILKALILSLVPTAKHAQFVREEFRGATAHDLGWLRWRLRQLKNATFPRAVLNDLAFVSTWSTDLRYTPGAGNPVEAELFINAVDRIVMFVKGRII